MKYFVRIDGSERGPYTAQLLESLVIHGHLRRHDLVRKANAQAYYRADLIRGLKSAFDARDDAVDDPTLEDTLPPLPGRHSRRLGIAGILFGALALGLFWMPFVGLFLSVLGMMLAGVGLVVAIYCGGAGMGHSLVGSAVSFAAILPAVLWLTFSAAEVDAVADRVADRPARPAVKQVSLVSPPKPVVEVEPVQEPQVEVAQVEPVHEPAVAVPAEQTPPGLIVKIPVQRKFLHDFTIKSEYDKFDKHTTITLHDVGLHDSKKQDTFLSDFAPDLDLTVFCAIDDGPPREVSPTARLHFSASSKSWKYLDFHPLVLLYDGKTVRFDMEHDGDIGSGYVLEFLTTSISLKTLSEIAACRKVEGRLGLTEFKLEERHLEAIRDLLSRLPAGPASFYELKRSNDYPVPENAKPEPKPEPKPQPKPLTPKEREEAAAKKLDLAKKLRSKKTMVDWLAEILRDYPETKAAEEAKVLHKRWSQFVD